MRISDDGDNIRAERISESLKHVERSAMPKQGPILEGTRGSRISLRQGTTTRRVGRLSLLESFAFTAETAEDDESLAGDAHVMHSTEGVAPGQSPSKRR